MIISDFSKLEIIFKDKKNTDLYLLLLKKISKKKKV